MLNWKQHAFAYKFVFIAITGVFVALIGHWFWTLGLFGHFYTDINIHDEFGEVCSFTQGPADFVGIEDLTLVKNQHVLYFAHPYRKTFANKALVKRLAAQIGLSQENITIGELLPLLPSEYRTPRIFTTDLATISKTNFPSPMPIEQVTVEGFDLEKYFEFYPLGADSYTDPLTNQHWINVVFMNRVGNHIAQFELIESVSNVQSSEPSSTKPAPADPKQGDHSNPDATAAKPSTSIKLRLVNVFSNSLWTTINGVAMVNQHEFYVSNFLTTDPIQDEFSALMELVLLRRNGSVLHCSSSPDAEHWDPVAYEMSSGQVVQLDRLPASRSFSTPFPLPTPQSSSELHCYEFISQVGQSNGIAVDHQHKQVIVTGGLAKNIIVFELGTHAYLQSITVPVGVDNLKIDSDNHDLYYGLNPSMTAVGGLISDLGSTDPSKKSYAPSAVFRLQSQSVEYSTRDLARKRLLKQLEYEGKKVEEVDVEQMEVSVTVLADQEVKDSQPTTYDHLQTQPDQQQPLPKKKTNKVEYVTKTVRLADMKDVTEWFHYFTPEPVPVYVDTQPFNKQTAPSALPIPLKYTKGLIEGMPDYKWVISGSIYDAGIEVCRVIQ